MKHFFDPRVQGLCGCGLLVSKVNKQSSFNGSLQQNWESLSSRVECSILGNVRCTPTFWKHLEDLEVGLNFASLIPATSAQKRDRHFHRHGDTVLAGPSAKAAVFVSGASYPKPRP